MPPPGRLKPPTQPSKPSKKPPKPKKPPPPPVELPELQSILTLFTTTFQPILTSPTLSTTLQTVKTHLYNRSYALAFSTPSYLEAYVARWTPSRALCYRHIFLSLLPAEIFTSAAEVVCIGGGAGGEVTAVAAAAKELGGRVTVQAVDSADWGSVFQTLVGGISGYLDAEYSAEFHHGDILAPGTAESVISEKTRLVTLCFTTNELYTQSRTDTTQFLLGLGGMVGKGCVLLVVESAGSYSTVKVGERVFDMGLLLEHTLLGHSQEGEEKVWELERKEDSYWYRFPPGLKYGLELENMRTMIRVFRRI